jgi:hypothetical protein
MSAGTASTTVVKNKSTDRDRAFWSHVESVAEQSRNIRGRSSSQRVDSRSDSITRQNDSDRHVDVDRS